MSRAKYWVFTLHFPSQQERDEWVFNGDVDDVTYAIAGRETGDNADDPTWHVQGYIAFKQRRRMRFVKRWIGSDQAHVETRRGSASEAWDYCAKEDGNPLTIGERPDAPDQGRRTDLEAVWDLLKGGGTLIQAVDQHPGTVIRNHRNLMRMLTIYRAATIPRFREVEVTVIYGDTGTGKTRYVVEQFEPEDLYICDLLADGWMDHYLDQKAILIDDFYGQVRAAKMLRILDGYRLQMGVKGSSAFAHYTKVFLTSNVHPNKWWTKPPAYPGGEETSTIPDSVRAAIMRRIDHIIHREA